MQESTRNKVGKAGEKLAEIFPKANVIRVFHRAVSTAALEEVWNNGTTVTQLGLDGERVLGRCEKDKRSLLIKDAEDSKLLEKLQQRSFSSCLCVPILDGSRAFVGLIYLCSRESDVFNTHGRFAVEKIAAELESALSTSFVPELVPAVDTQRGNSFFKLAAVGVGLIMTFLFVRGGSQFVARYSGSAEQGAAEVSRPKDVAKKFAQSLRVGEFASAWESLSPELQGRWPLEDFKASLDQWSRSERNQALLLSRKLSGLARTEQGFRAVFLAAEGDAQARWDWEMKSYDEEWRIFGLAGGPVLPPEDSP